MENRKFSFEVSAVWSEDKKVKISSPVLPDDIETVIPPPFFNGIAGHWSAEHLFLASIASCYAHTFQYLSRTAELPFDGFSCQVTGDAELVNRVFAFHKVQLSVTLTIPLETYRGKAESVLEKTERNCLVRNSLKTEVLVETKILVSEYVGELIGEPQ